MSVEQSQRTNTRTGNRMKRILRLLLKIIGILAIAAALFLAIVFIVNVVSSKSEQGKIIPYGQLVPVDGKQMNVTIEGQGDETVVLLPGFGTAAPALDFKLLMDELSPYYRVVAIEPFGYGLSDGTDSERTTANIVKEIHEALQQLNIDRYILMGHSIAGIYALDYVNKYPEEVTAFAGIDSSVPEQGGMDAEFPMKSFKFLKKSGLLRFVMKISGDPYASSSFDDQTKQQMRMLSYKNSNNDTTLNEMKHISANFKDAQQLSFPKAFPVILFVQADNTEVEDWLPQHEAQVRPLDHGRVVTLEGEHYLHHTQSKAIAENFRAFMNEAEPK
ncbi:Putative aminoacrylate hydrolase RutD [Paenibacillus auburnensis]|uniref:Aminoacrylate hydrolase RutD n=2 Tax=Paenibacillus auburnensis TaxID=2905649 RepID=A0ABM9BTG3_9BACL|nr:alpha/beta hydrolase [Paenibacillus auburnensis]CAH1192985.1 Putative aminoacrylate hydrolase RutD [Paenibacillus auburnensis]